MALLFGRKNTAEAKIKINYDGKEAKRGLKGLDKNVKGLRKSFASAKSSMGLMAIGLAALTLAAIKAKKAIDFTVESLVKFEAAGAKLRAIIKPTTEEFAALEKQAQELGKTTVFTASQVLESFTEMGKLGLKTNEILAAGNDVLSLAALAQVNMAEAAIITTQALNQFNLEADQARRVVDVIALSFTNSALDITKFSEAMKFIGPLAGTTGESIEDVTGALALLADNALDSSLAGTAMRRILLELANANSKASKRIAATGKEAKTLTDKLKILKEMQISVTEATELFGLRAATGATIVINNANAVEILSKKFSEADGAAQEMADTMLDSVEGASIRLKSAQEALALSIKDEMIPALRAWKELQIDITLGMTKILPMFVKMQKVIFTSLTLEDIRIERIIKQSEITNNQNILLEVQKEKLQEIEDADKKILERRKTLVKEGLVDSDVERNLVGLYEKKLKLRDQELKIALSLAMLKKEEGDPTSETFVGPVLPVVRERPPDTSAAKAAAKQAEKEAEKEAKRLAKVRLEQEKMATKALLDGEEDRLKDLEQLQKKSKEKEIEDLEEFSNQRLEALERIGNIGLTQREININSQLELINKWHMDEIISTEEHQMLLTEIEARQAEERIKNRAREEQNKIMVSQQSLSSANTINNAIIGMIELRSQREIEELERLNLSEEDFTQNREKILNEGIEQQRAFARVAQRIAVVESWINVYAAATDVFNTQVGGVFTKSLAMGAAIAQGALTVAKIQRQNFQTGGIAIGGVKRSRQVDDTTITIGGGESVISAPQTAIHKEALEAIQNNTANTSRGLQQMRGGNIVNNFFSVSTEQMLSASINNDRRNRVGRKI